MKQNYIYNDWVHVIETYYYFMRSSIERSQILPDMRHDVFFYLVAHQSYHTVAIWVNCKIINNNFACFYEFHISIRTSSCKHLKTLSPSWMFVQLFAAVRLILLNVSFSYKLNRNNSIYRNHSKKKERKSTTKTIRKSNIFLLLSRRNNESLPRILCQTQRTHRYLLYDYFTTIYLFF